jgi:glycine betaine/choline ABC-type transport system substrate-binding protein
MVKKTLLYIFMLSVILLNQRVEACVGKTLFIGVTNAPNERLFAEMISVLVTERTGTSVKIVAYKDARAMYSAVKKGEVGVFIDNAERALNILGRPAETNSRTAYETAKKAYRSSQNLVWLEPFGGSQYYAPVISLETINNLPALPKLVNKLGGMVNDETCARLLKGVKSDDKPGKVAKEFLKARKLI